MEKADYYDKKYYDRYFAHDNSKEYKQRIKEENKARAFVLYQWCKPQTSLELGCGTGIVVSTLKKHGVDAKGIDLSKWVTDGKDYLINGNIATCDYPKVDLICSFDLLEHLTIEEIDKTLKKCKGTPFIFHSISVGFEDYGDVTHLKEMDKTHISMYSPIWWFKKFYDIYNPDYFITIMTRRDFMEGEGYRFTNTNFLLSKKQTSVIQKI